MLIPAVHICYFVFSDNYIGRHKASHVKWISHINNVFFFLLLDDFWCNQLAIINFACEFLWLVQKF